MDLEKAACVKAILSRDGRFAGRFFVGVVTTRVYCRPGCPAPLPKPRNMRFYAYAAAAEDAGFRPCRRCRPETAPGSPVWNGTSATVSRALKRIFDGDGHESVEALAARLGLGSRHLRRLFAEHVGASPASLQRTHRVHFARRLLDETSLPAADVAFASGFESVRRFNDAIRATFHRTPTGLRKSSGAKSRPAAEGTGTDGRPLTLRLPLRLPFDATSLYSFLEERALPGVEAVRGHAYSRTIESRGRAGVLTVSYASGQDFLRLSTSLAPGPDLLDFVRRAGRVFDVDADPRAIADVLGRDSLLAPLVAARPGLRVPGAWDPFELSVRAILGQQVSVRGARTLAGRLVAAFGRPLPGGGADGLTHLFPPPAALAAADLSGIGIPAARATAIRTLAAAVSTGRIELTAARGLEDFEARLCALPGIGPWTAQYVALRAFGEPDAFPAGDLGLRRALETARVPAGAAALRERAAAWSPFRAYATLHLWSSLAPDAGRGKKETR